MVSAKGRLEGQGEGWFCFNMLLDILLYASHLAHRARAWARAGAGALAGVRARARARISVRLAVANSNPATSCRK